MAKSNKVWGTAIYSLAVEEREEQFYINIQGVRFSDIQQFFEVVLDVGPDDYTIKDYLAAERYFVLSPAEAHWLSEELGGRQHKGKGRLSRKEFLLKAFLIPVTVKKRTPMAASLCIYRIDRGATAAYKCEIRLHGKRRNRHTFFKDDIKKLDKKLKQLVNDHDLHPLEKPCRWEPIDTNSKNKVRYDSSLRNLPHKAWRGTKLPYTLLEKCNTPTGLKLGITHLKSDGYLPSPRIREGNSTFSDGIDDSHPPLCSKGGSYNTPNRSVWDTLAQDIHQLPGYLMEVVLDADQDPAPFLQALTRSNPNIGISALYDLDTWYSVKEMIPQYPVVEGIDLLTIVIDQNVMTAGQEQVCKFDGKSFTSGPLAPSERFDVMDWTDTYIRATACVLWPVFWQLRELSEKTGLKVVVISADARPVHGNGPVQKSHYFRDTRVRSTIGDAGRYWCHMRYRVDTNHNGEAESVVLIKDEHDGCTGRMLDVPRPWDEDLSEVISSIQH